MSEKKSASAMVVGSIRATRAEWDAWQRAAELTGLARSEWMRHSLACAAELVFKGESDDD